MKRTSTNLSFKSFWNTLRAYVSSIWVWLYSHEELFDVCSVSVTGSNNTVVQVRTSIVPSQNTIRSYTVS